VVLSSILHGFVRIRQADLHHADLDQQPIPFGQMLAWSNPANLGHPCVGGLDDELRIVLQRLDFEQDIVVWRSLAIRDIEPLQVEIERILHSSFRWFADNLQENGFPLGVLLLYGQYEHYVTGVSS
jgi:hypothetical protein